MSEIEVPKGWEIGAISELTISFDNLRIPLNASQRNNKKGIYPYYGASGMIDSINDYKYDGKFLLISEDGENLNTQKKPIAFIVEGKFWVNNHAHVIQTTEKLNMNYLCYYINSLKIMKYAKKQATRPKLKKSDLEKIPIIYPALSVQKQIVQKLGNTLGQLEEKKKQILELQTNKIKYIKILSDKTIGNIISKLMHLDSSPDSWDIQKIENICQDIQPGFAEGKKNVKDGVIHLRMNNIGTNFDLNFNLIRTIEANKDQLKKYQLKQGDVVFNNTNSSKLVGKSAIFNDSKVCLYSNHLTRLRVKKELVLPEWLLFYFRARWLNGDFERMCNKWINQAAVNNNKIKNLEIPVPNLETQKKIIESLSNVSKNIEAIRIISETILIQEKINLTHFQNLSSKILDSAFSGKLVN